MAPLTPMYMYTHLHIHAQITRHPLRNMNPKLNCQQANGKLSNYKQARGKLPWNKKPQFID